MNWLRSTYIDYYTWFHRNTYHEACENGDVEVVKKFLSSEVFNPVQDDYFQVYPIFIACNYDKPDILRLLLASSHYKPTNKYFNYVRSARILKILLEDKRLNPAESDRHKKLMVEACAQGNIDIVRLLLKDGRIDPSLYDNAAIFTASKKGHIGIVRLLAEDPRVDPHKAFFLGGIHLGVLQLLLDNPRFDPSFNNNQLISEACMAGDIESVKLLLANDRLKNPFVYSQYNSLVQTTMYKDFTPNDKNRDKIVSLLLADPRYIPELFDFFTLCSSGYTDGVLQLLKNPDIDPSYLENLPIRRAFKEGHTDVVGLLLADKWLEWTEEVIRIAKEMNVPLPLHLKQ